MKEEYTEEDYTFEVLQGKHRYFEFGAPGELAIERIKSFDKARAHHYFVSKLRTWIDPKFLKGTI